MIILDNTKSKKHFSSKSAADTKVHRLQVLQGNSIFSYQINKEFFVTTLSQVETGFSLSIKIEACGGTFRVTKFTLNHHEKIAIAYFENLLKKYGKGKERKTEIKLFDTIKVQQITIANTKLYANREEGFIGTSLKKDEFLFECSDLDDIIVFTK